MKKTLLQILLFCLSFGIAQAGNPPDNQQVVTIPVVVQIHYSNSDLRYKLTMDQVASQIDALNKDFSATNADFSITALQNFDQANGTNFAQVAAKNPITGKYGCQIQFALAQRNEAGEGCTGVTYIAHNDPLPTIGGNNSIKLEDDFPVEKYLHIYVAPRIIVQGSSVRGDSWDFGCSIKSECFGTLEYNPALNPDNVPQLFYLDQNFKEGGIVTHEIGHVLGLAHLWVDNLSETPPQTGPNLGCNPPYIQTPAPSNQKTVSMSMNYMDYPYDPCIYMFCQQQRTKMRKVLFDPSRKFIDTDNKALLGPNCLVVTGLKHTLTFPDGTNDATVDLIWDADGASGYRVKIFTKDKEGNWELLTEPINVTKPHCSSTLTPGKIYRAEVYAKCFDNGYSYPQEIIFDVPDFANAIPLTGFNLTANLSAHTSGKLCDQGVCQYPLYDIYSFDTYTAPMPSFRAMVEDPSGMTELYLYYTDCEKVGEGTKLECGMDSVHFLQTTDDDPEYFDASVPGWKPRETIFKPCDGARYKYYLVVAIEKEPEINVGETPYDLSVSLLSDYPICSSKSRMGGINAGDAQAEITPNPSHGIYHINSSQAIRSITIVDNSGRMILQMDSPSQEIDLTNYAAGMYMARIVTDKGVVTKKLIKQ